MFKDFFTGFSFPFKRRKKEVEEDLEPYVFVVDTINGHERFERAIGYEMDSHGTLTVEVKSDTEANNVHTYPSHAWVTCWTEDKQLTPKEEFIQALDKAIDACYACDMENNGAVLTLPLTQLYTELRLKDKP